MCSRFRSLSPQLQELGLRVSALWQGCTKSECKVVLSAPAACAFEVIDLLDDSDDEPLLPRSKSAARTSAACKAAAQGGTKAGAQAGRRDSAAAAALVIDLDTDDIGRAQNRYSIRYSSTSCTQLRCSLSLPSHISRPCVTCELWL